MAERPVYLYGVVRAGAAHRPAHDGVGGAAVSVLADDVLGAVISELPWGEFKARREDVMAHYDVLQDLVDRAGVLPMSFGTVFSSSAELLDAFLRPNRAALAGMLDSLDDAVEVQVKAEYEGEAIAREIASSDRSLGKLQQRARERDDVESKIELGRRFAELLEKARYADARRIVDALAPMARDVSVGEARGEYALASVSLLVARDEVARVYTAADEIAASIGGRAKLRCLGPLPPYSFVDAGALVIA